MTETDRSSRFFTVLIADDEPAIRNGIKNAIDWDSIGLRISATVQDGNSAYDEICRHKPDIVITDIMMPGKTGLELIKEAKAAGIASRFIILSGYDDFRYAKEAISLEVESFLLKPLSRAELIETLKRTIDRIKTTEVKAQEYQSLSESACENLLRKLASGENIEQSELKPVISYHPGPVTAMLIQKHDDDPETDRILQQCMDGIEHESFQWDGRTTAVLLHYDSEYARHIANMIISKKEDGKCRMTIAIGPSAPDIMRFNESFQSCMTALSYQIYDQDKTIFDQDSIVNDTPPEFNPSDVDLVSLTHMMFSKEDNRIQEWIKRYFARLMYIKTPPPSYIKGMCIYLLTDLTRTISHEKHISSKFMPKIDYQQINELLTLRDIEKWTTDLILYMTHTSIPESEIANDPVIYKARKLIKDSLGFQLSAQQVAKELNMNFTYFSSYYKQKTGENFSAYINRMRNDYAKQLLDDPMLSIEEVSQSLGYTDYRSFYRNFKKTNGITPSKYRSHK